MALHESDIAFKQSDIALRQFHSHIKQFILTCRSVRLPRNVTRWSTRTFAAMR